MNKILVTLLLSIVVANSSFSQSKITLSDVWGAAITPKRMEKLQVMKRSNQYTVLNYGNKYTSSTIDLYDFYTLKKIETLFDSQYFNINLVEDYQFSTDEKKILINTSITPIYRHSYSSVVYVYDIDTKTIVKVANHPIQEAEINPQGDKVAYVWENNLYVFDLNTQTRKQITFDGKANKIINGVSDWVYEEEFGISKAYQWNKNGTKIAYIKFNEEQVPQFSMDVYGNGLYPTQQVFKYPKAGENNSKVSLHIYDLIANDNAEVYLNQPYYIPRIKWTQNADFLSVQTLNRHQNDLNLYLVDANTLKSKIILNEKDNAYVEITDNLDFLSDNSFIWTSEKDGYNHIYHYDRNGKLINKVTDGKWEVTKLYGVDEKNKKIYYQSVENGSINRGIYSISLNGKNKNKLSVSSGINSAQFNFDFSYYINNHSSYNQAPRYTLNNAKTGKDLKNILDNKALENYVKKFELPQKEFFEIENQRKDKLNAWMLKPKNFDATKKYPLLMFQYSGPGSQEVKNEWYTRDDYWYAMLTQMGYIVLCVDGTGTGFKGAEFKKATQNQLGKLEVEDQIFVAKQMANKPHIDAQRIGIWGWSFGGFMSSNCLFQAPEVFKMAIAVAPVTNWRFYDTIYTERFMTTPQENPTGYDNNSPITHAHNLKGKYLLIHGSADDNVHLQNAMALINRLVHLNKDFEWAIYPDKNHGIYGGYTREQLYTKMTNFIVNNL